MHKCPKCGTEFEGNFCPECGEKFAEEKACPKCGAKLSGGAKFCNECGYSFYEKPVPAPTPSPQPAKKQLSAGVEKLYAAVSALPAALFGVLSVLLFLFFLAPVAVIPGGEFLGEKIPSTSYGSVYEFANYEGLALKNSVITFIVFAALALFVALILVIANVFSKQRYKRFTLAGKQIFMRSILTAVGYALFFALFLVSCISMGQIAGEDGGLGLMQAGAAPILVLVFTLLGGLVAAGCAFAGAYLRKSYPALVAATEKKVAAAKPTRAETWLKNHKKVVVALSAALVVAIVVGVAVPVGLANRYNGVYYAYNGETEEYNTERFYKLSGNTWEDESGERGKITFDGEKVTLTYGISDASAITSEGTISGDVLKIGGAVYAKGGHTHAFGDWETIVEPTCATSGTKTETCVCGRSNREELPALGHSYTNRICVRCGQNSNLELEYTLNEEATGYSVTDIGTCHDLEIIIPAEFNNKPVTSIGRYAFRYCSKLTSVEIPNTVTEIGEGAFYGCNRLASIEIPNTVTSIGAEAFEYCSGLTSVIWNAENCTTGGHDAIFENCAQLTTVTFGENVKTIPSYAFYGCSGLTSVTIGSGVTSIGNSAFSGCSALTSIEIPDGVTSIGVSAFYDCSGLTSITIPTSVTSIGNSAFSDCNGLTSVIWNAENCTTRLSIFENCAKLTTVTFGENVKTIPAYAFEYCSGPMSVTIGSGVTSIGEGAFEYCSGLKSIVIPDNVTSIGAQAFYRCSGLENVSIGSGMAEIGTWAFVRCDYLEHIKVATGNPVYRSENDCLIEIQSNTLILGCKNSSIPNYVTKIGDFAYAARNGLSEIKIPDSVTEIGDCAFAACYELTSIQFQGTVKAWQTIQKGIDWNYDTTDYTVTCTDGTIAKDGTIKYFNN